MVVLPKISVSPPTLKIVTFVTRTVRLPAMAGGDSASLLERLHFAKGIDPVADAFAGANVRTDVYSMANHESLLFIIYQGVGATGTSTLIVNSCDDVTPTTRTPIKYRSRDVLTTDVQGAITARAAAGYIPTLGNSKITIIEVAAQDLVAGDKYVELEMDEGTDSPVLGGVLVIAGDGRYLEAVSPTILT